MSANREGRLASLRRILRSWQAAAAVAAILLVALLLWVMPRRVERVVSVEGQEWDAGQAPARRQVVWAEARPVEVTVPGARGPGKLIAPRLADGGATLYFTFRGGDGQADIYRARLEGGRWL